MNHGVWKYEGVELLEPIYGEQWALDRNILDESTRPLDRIDVPDCQLFLPSPSFQLLY